jgi:multidrug efflux system membrane fusion protein
MTTPPPGDTPHKRGRWYLRPLVVIPLGLAIIVGTVWWRDHVKNQNAQAFGGRGGWHGSFGPMPVVAKAAEKGDIDVTFNALGTVTPLATVVVRAQTSGQLVEVGFKEGQKVEKGDLLAVIDPRPYQVALEQATGQFMQAQAQLKNAQADLARYETLSQQDSIAAQQVDSARALVSQYTGLVQVDQAAIDNANLNLTYCHIKAPVSGRVGLRQVDPGNNVTPGDANGIVVLTELQPITVIFTLPEDNIPAVSARLRSGAAIPVDAYNPKLTEKLAVGRLETIDNEVDVSTGTFKLRAVFDNKDEALFPNQFVNVKMLLDVKKDVLVIPTSAVERGQQGTYVYYVKPDNTVTARTVALGTSEGERIEVLSGLDAGDRVVVDGADRLREGSQVVIQGETAPAAPAPKAGAADDGSRRRGGGRNGRRGAGSAQ